MNKNKKMTPSEALVAYINSIPDYLRSGIYPELLEAASKVKTAESAAVIISLLGAASSYGQEIPSAPVKFPQDHSLHLKSGTEWYWISCNLEVEGSGGLDKIGVLAVMTRNRAVSNDVQKAAGWTDVEAQVVDTAATVTVATRTDSFIARRRPNVQWSAAGGNVKFGSDPFLYQNGADYMKGSKNVLPLKVHIDDKPNMSIDLTMSSDLPATKAFFLQGQDGITPEPTPGIYYSYAQLSVKGKVSVGGKTYAVKGTGWIDHQLMMMSTLPPQPPVPPLPPPPIKGWKPITPRGGWSWCQFNLSNGDAFTVAAFQHGTTRVNLPVSYGWYVQRTKTGWNKFFLMGALEIDRFIPTLEEVMMPTAWIYQVADAESGGLISDITLSAVPWYPDGSFYTGNLAVEGETPVNVALVDRAPQNGEYGRGRALTGTGYCESVSYEPPDEYLERALAYLKAND